jgi:Zn-dependent M28 family amino/carboxypeptidase
VLTEAGAEVSFHTFEHTSTGSTQSANFTNIIGRINPNEQRRVLIGTHYDTRSWADRDPVADKRSQPIIGANDGGSGVAVMLEMAKTWKDAPPRIGVDLIFFDGEDFGSGQNWGDYFLGSRAWMRDHPEYRPEWGVIIDMVGDASLEISEERNSSERAPAVVSKVWDAAKRVQSKAFRQQAGGKIMDDHAAFLDNQIPVILLIDFTYPYFHTTQDTPDKCSPDSLGQVGRAVMEAVESS